MTPGRLRSIEGIGVPLLLVFTIVSGAWYTSSSLTRYQERTDSRIVTLESTSQDLVASVKELTNTTRAMGLLLQSVVENQRKTPSDQVSRGTLYVWCIRNFAKSGDFAVCDSMLDTPVFDLRGETWRAKTERATPPPTGP